jgi:UDP-N-acetylmuramoyl-L-alanyl-D-glutamate--2,6-diaminopimelate ligase
MVPAVFVRRGSVLVEQKRSFPVAPTWLKSLCHVGVTGTNGKTSTCHFLAAILNRVTSPVALLTTVGTWLGDRYWDALPSYGSQLDLMRACLDAGGRFAVLETTSEILARGFAQVWPYRVGVFTNLTQDHLDAHRSAEHYFASKAQLFRCLPVTGTAVINGCDPVADLLAEVTPSATRRLVYGSRSRGEPALPLDLELEAVDLDWTGSSARVEGPALGAGGPATLRVRGIGTVFLENALAALGAALALDVPLRLALDALAKASIPAGRFELVGAPPHVVVDYAHTPDALARAVSVAKTLTRGDVHVVFGAGGDRDASKRPELGRAAAAASHLLVTSDNPRSEAPEQIAAAILAGVPAGAAVEVELDRERAIRRAVAQAGEGDVVLVAGKGHERSQLVGSAILPFDDAEVARAALRERHRG